MSRMIHVLMRHCNATNSKPRPAWFDKEAVFKRFLESLDGSCRLTVMFDGDARQHFVSKYAVDVVRFDGGCDAASFANCLLFACQQSAVWDTEDIVYFVEDDYLHKPGWPEVLREGMTQADIVSLFDHRDKYKPGAGGCRLTFTPSCHWRTAISTTNTFAVRYGQLLEDMPIYQQFANPSINKITVDHEKFIQLFRAKGRVLVTSVPAWSTHCEEGSLAPAVQWSDITH